MTTEYEKHPSFGMVSFNRVTGGNQRLFGSHLASHHEKIVLRVYQGEVKNDLGQDWYGVESLMPLVEVQFSPAQFASLLTTMNVGFGVPGTITTLGGEQIEEVPETHKLEHERITDAFAEKINGLKDGLDDRFAEIEELVFKKGALKKAEKERILWLVKEIFSGYRNGNADFILRQFRDSTEKIVTEARAQVDEFVTSTLARLGIQALQDKFRGSVIGELEE